MRILTLALVVGLSGCATCSFKPVLTPACPQDLPCVETDKGVILYMECNDVEVQ